MAGATISNVRLVGVASAVPPLRQTDFETLRVPEECFKRARACHRRPSIRAAAWEQCQSDFCVAAAEALLSQLGWTASEVDVVVLVTLTPDFPIPATAIILQDRLGISKSAAAFDLPGGEATFFHGLQLVASMLSAGHLRRGLLLCGEVSKMAEGPESIEAVDIIWGHNGSVCALEHTAGAPPMHFAFGGQGSAHQSFIMPVGGTRSPPRVDMFKGGRETAFANPAMNYTLDMEAVEAAALRELPGCLEAVLARAGRPIGEVDHFFLQPITRLTDDSLRRHFGFPPDRFHSLTAEYGRGGSGGIVLAMLARAARELARGPCVSLLGGIGAGLAWSSALISTENLVAPPPLEM